jgi:hypothetical protein
MLVGIQTILMGILARIFSYNFGMLPKTKTISRSQRYFKLERGIILGLLLILLSIFGFIFLFSDWSGAGFESLTPSESLRIAGGIMLIHLSGIQILFASFFAAMLETSN